MMRDSLTPAILSLVGVLIGGAVTSASNLLIAIVRERAERVKIAESSANARRRAARLLDAELSMARALIVLHIERKEWWQRFDRLISLELWKQYAPILAPELTNEAWWALVLAYAAVSVLLTESLGDSVLDDHQIEGLKDDVSHIDEAVKHLKPICESTGDV